jgi:hypothetical protein
LSFNRRQQTVEFGNFSFVRDHLGVLIHGGQNMRYFTCVVLAFYICASVLHAAEPQKSNDSRVEAIVRSVTIYRDTYGAPHVYGPTDASVVFGFVYAQAEDSFPQIEENYIRALGRASEFYGQDIGEAYEKETSFGDDLLVKLFEMPRLSQAEAVSASWLQFEFLVVPATCCPSAPARYGQQQLGLRLRVRLSPFFAS